MQIGKYKFRPSLWLTLVSAVVIALFMRLGFWQIHRGEEKQTIMTMAAQQQKLPPLILKNGVAVDLQMTQYRTVSVQGTYAPQYAILLDNKIYQGRPGYQLLAPLQISGANSYVLINRGWIDMGPSRQQLPKISIPTNEVTIEGMLQLPKSNMEKFGGGNRSNQGWPALFRWIDIPTLVAETGLPLKPYVILQQSTDDSGLVHDWPLISDTSDKNYAYAAQWFTFAGIVLLLWIKLNLQRRDEA